MTSLPEPLGSNVRVGLLTTCELLTSMPPPLPKLDMGTKTPFMYMALTIKGPRSGLLLAELLAELLADPVPPFPLPLHFVDDVGLKVVTLQLSLRSDIASLGCLMPVSSSDMLPATEVPLLLTVLDLLLRIPPQCTKPNTQSFSVGPRSVRLCCHCEKANQQPLPSSTTPATTPSTMPTTPAPDRTGLDAC